MDEQNVEDNNESVDVIVSRTDFQSEMLIEMQFLKAFLNQKLQDLVRMDHFNDSTYYTEEDIQRFNCVTESRLTSNSHSPISDNISTDNMNSDSDSLSNTSESTKVSNDYTTSESDGTISNNLIFMIESYLEITNKIICNLKRLLSRSKFRHKGRHNETHLNW